MGIAATGAGVTGRPVTRPAYTRGGWQWGRPQAREGSQVKVAIPREVKNHEYRVAITPAGVHEFVRHGHEVYIEAGAGLGSSITDEEVVPARAPILPHGEDVWATRELILQVKEPDAPEYPRLRPGPVPVTYLH